MIQYTIGIYQKYKELVNYLIVGVLTTLVSWATYYVCVEWMLNPDIYWQLQVAVLLRWVSGVIFAYFTNRKYVFESKNTKSISNVIKKSETNYDFGFSILNYNCLILYI